ncbi:MAG: DUF1257 domain-containing protein [Anaerolineae bacterium]|nr:DUF1257 domain-containing protein [Anaerolineae bacterium]
MSHFSRISTKLRDIDIVKEALTDLEYMVRENAEVRGFSRWEKARADIVITAEDGRDIGFRDQGGEIEIIADFWGRGSFNRDEFVEKVTQRYAYRTIINKAKEQGFEIVADEQQEDGSIRVVVQRW